MAIVRNLKDINTLKLRQKSKENVNSVLLKEFDRKKKISLITKTIVLVVY